MRRCVCCTVCSWASTPDRSFGMLTQNPCPANSYHASPQLARVPAHPAVAGKLLLLNLRPNQGGRMKVTPLALCSESLSATPPHLQTRHDGSLRRRGHAPPLWRVSVGVGCVIVCGGTCVVQGRVSRGQEY